MIISKMNVIVLFNPQGLAWICDKFCLLIFLYWQFDVDFYPLCFVDVFLYPFFLFALKSFTKNGKINSLFDFILFWLLSMFKIIPFDLFFSNFVLYFNNYDDNREVSFSFPKLKKRKHVFGLMKRIFSFFSIMTTIIQK